MRTGQDFDAATAPFKANEGGRGTRALVTFRVGPPPQMVLGDAMTSAPSQGTAAALAQGAAIAADGASASGGGGDGGGDGAFRLDMKLAFGDLSVEQFGPRMVRTFSADVGDSLGVSAERVQVRNIEAGSVIVTASVVGFYNKGKVDAAVSSVLAGR